jgi:hypothetical protein
MATATFKEEIIVIDGDEYRPVLVTAQKLNLFDLNGFVRDRRSRIDAAALPDTNNLEDSLRILLDDAVSSAVQ